MSNLASNEIEDFNVSLHTIPVEIFLHICTFLEGKEIIHSLKYVCRNFYEILSDDSVWRTWLRHRWPKLPTSNICYKDDVIPSHTACIQADRGFKLWSKEKTNIKKWIQNTVHISTVDTVKLIQGGRIGISGSRDRSLAVWNTDGELNLLEQKSNAHCGWIWALAACSETNRLFSCSWDSTVKQWHLDQHLLESASFSCKAAALSLACRPGLIAAGLFTPQVEMFDPRNSSCTPVNTYSSHSRSIMALCFVRDFIVSASEDQTISIWDITAGKILKSGIQCGDGYPMTLSLSDGNLLFVGDTKSKLHVYDTNNDSFELLESFDLGHMPRGTITSMWHNPGLIVTGSKDETVRIHTATRPPHLINCLMSSNGGVTSLDFADAKLFFGCVNSAVEMWMPLKDDHFDDTGDSCLHSTEIN